MCTDTHNRNDSVGLTQVTTEQIIIIDDYCIVAGTDTNYP